MAAFSTLGLPGAPIEVVAAAAVTHGFAGVELRVGDGEAVHVGLGAAERLRARLCLERAGIEVLAVASYVKVVDPATDDAAVLADARAHLQLAHDLGAPHLRVFPGGPQGRRVTAVDDERGGRRLAAIAEAAREVDVAVALETHDSHGAAACTRALLDHPGCHEVVAIWDVLHTWLAGEAPPTSRALLGDRLAYVQVKDVPSRTDPTPLPPGDGVLPLGEVAAALTATSYAGWASWEYELAWNPAQPTLCENATRVRRWIEQWLAA